MRISDLLRSLALLGAAACTTAPGDAATARRIELAVLDERFTLGRLAHQTSAGECAPVPDELVVPRARCGAPALPGSPRFDRIDSVVRDARAWLRAGASPEALHARGLVELRLRTGSDLRDETIVAPLAEASRRTPHDAARLNDLSVAYLALAEGTRQLRPALRALDAAERAVGEDSTLRPALFNRAVARERLYLVRTAGRAWARYVAAEPDARWRREGEAGEARLASWARSDPWAGPADAWLASAAKAPRTQVATRVRENPQAAREMAFVLFREWGVAAARGDTMRASQILGVARQVGEALAEGGGDVSVLSQARALDAARARRDVQHALAVALASFGRGSLLFAASAYAPAADTLARASRALHVLGAPIARWADFYLAAARVSRGDYAGGDRLLQRVLADAAPGELALSGKAMLALGVSQLRRGGFERAIGWYREGAERVARAHEEQNAGFAAYLLAEALGLTGRRASSEEEGFRALRLLSRYRTSNYLANLLAQVAARARADGLPFAALAIMNEMLAVAHDVDKPELTALALCARAGDLMAVGRAREAEADLDEAERSVQRVSRDRAFDRIRATVLLTRGQLLLARDPRAALPVLVRATTAFRGFQRDHHLPEALFELSRASRATGDPSAARAALVEAIGHLERQSAGFRTSELRTALAETVEHVFDAMIALELDAGRPASALDYLERGRVLGWSPDVRTAMEPAQPPNASDVALLGALLPGDMALLETAVLPDRLVVWTVSRRGIQHRELPVSRDSVAALVAWQASDLSLDADGASPASTALYDLVVRPMASALRGTRRLAIVPDRELSRVPFASLRDRTTGRYLVESYEPRTVPSAAFLRAAMARSRAAPRLSQVLVVGDPLLDSATARNLVPLAGATAEAERVAVLYPGARLLMRGRARRASLLALLPSAGLFHFAGHAVFDGERPELSYLALHPSAPGDDGRLQAREIGALRLSNAALVVLSACSTTNARSSHAGPMDGLAYSFLRAGAPGMVSSLWDVSDAGTTGLLVAFHRHLTRGAPAATALRLAQLDALHSPAAEQRAPRNWAAFTYTGP